MVETEVSEKKFYAQDESDTKMVPVRVPIHLYNKAKDRKVSFTSAMVKGLNDILETGTNQKNFRKILDTQADIMQRLTNIEKVLHTEARKCP